MSGDERCDSLAEAILEARERLSLRDPRSPGAAALSQVLAEAARNGHTEEWANQRWEIVESRG